MEEVLETQIAVFKCLVGDSENVINIFLLRQTKLLTKIAVFPAGTWYYDCDI